MARNVRIEQPFDVAVLARLDYNLEVTLHDGPGDAPRKSRIVLAPHMAAALSSSLLRGLHTLQARLVALAQSGRA